MAGPTASILVPSPAYQSRVCSLLSARFPDLEANPIPLDNVAFDGWITKRPFFVDCGWAYKREIEDFDFDGFQKGFGWSPVDQVTIAAMCNDDIDHRLLAQICVAIAEEFHGAVNFGGRPFSLTDDIIKSLSGKPIALAAFDGGVLKNPELSVCFADSTFVSEWLHHPSFRMVK